jgi:uncharacterized protein YbjQ (UPF0145 family)
VLVTTTWNVAGHEVVETIGEVFGLTVRSRSIFANIAASFRAMFGGEVKFYTNLLEVSREQAVDRMIARAEEKGANAILSMRFDASELSSFMTEIVAYGTAAIIEPSAAT